MCNRALFLIEIHFTEGYNGVVIHFTKGTMVLVSEFWNTLKLEKLTECKSTLPHHSSSLSLTIWLTIQQRIE